MLKSGHSSNFDILYHELKAEPSRVSGRSLGKSDVIDFGRFRVASKRDAKSI